MTLKRVRRLLFITSCAYMVVTLSFTILPIELTSEVTPLALQQTLGICFGTAVMAEISFNFNFRNVWAGIICTYLAVTFAVFLLGTVVFQMIPLKFDVYGSILIIILLIYLVVYFVFFEKNKNDANTINKQLHRKGSNRK